MKFSNQCSEIANHNLNLIEEVLGREFVSLDELIIEFRVLILEYELLKNECGKYYKLLEMSVSE